MKATLLTRVLFGFILGAAGPATATSLDSTLSTDNWLPEALDNISVERMLADIKTLSSPLFRGRQTGTDQDKESATLVADRFSTLRLHRTFAPFPQEATNPLPRLEWKQASPVRVTAISDHPILQIGSSQGRAPLQVGQEFLPILDSPSVATEAPVVFVGYGLVDPTQNFNEYAGLDVRNKIVLFLRGKPDRYAGPFSHADKERIARRLGAAAYFTATGPILSPYEKRRGVTGRPSAFYSTLLPEDQLPGAWISTELAEAILQDGTKGRVRLRDLQDELNRSDRPQSRSLDLTARLEWESRTTTGTLYNIASMIRGYAPNSEEAVLIGAHRDHFGRQAGLLFAGADDNASGTAVLLEVARVMASSPVAPKRSVLFLSFSGEEQGLLGSKLYVSQPIVPLSKTVAMINVDHAGIGNGRLTVGVTGLEKETAQSIGQLAGLDDTLDFFGFFPGGDHVPFKEAGVPTVTVVSGGVHPHFHQPTDTADTINPSILKAAAQYVLALAWQLANTP
jgi:hypothetical protein